MGRAPVEKGEGRADVVSRASRSPYPSHALQRALRKYVEADDPDVLILTEVKWPEAATHAALEWIRPRYKVRRCDALRSIANGDYPASGLTAPIQLHLAPLLLEVHGHLQQDQTALHYSRFA